MWRRLGGKVVANSEVTRKMGPMSHVGGLGIAIKAGYRNTGTETETMKTLIEESRKMGLKVLVLDVFASNKRARHVYEKVGSKNREEFQRHLQKERIHRLDHNDHDTIIPLKHFKFRPL